MKQFIPLCCRLFSKTWVKNFFFLSNFKHKLEKLVKIWSKKRGQRGEGSGKVYETRCYREIRTFWWSHQTSLTHCVCFTTGSILSKIIWLVAKMHCHSVQQKLLPFLQQFEGIGLFKTQKSSHLLFTCICIFVYVYL